MRPITEEGNRKVTPEEGFFTMRVRSSILIHLSAETVFAYVSDVKRFSQNMQNHDGEPITYHFFGIPIVLKTHTARLKDIRQTSAGHVGVGTSFVQEYTSLGISFEITLQISEYDPFRNILCKFSRRIVPSGEGQSRVSTCRWGTRVIEEIESRRRLL